MEIANASNFSTDMDQANINQAGNVQLAQSDSAVTSELRGPQPVQQDVVREGHLDKIAKELTDRWIMIAEFNIDTNQTQGEILYTADLPTALYETAMTRGSNAYSILQNYMYFRADVELTFEVAATRMQTGQLQVSYYYAQNEDLNKVYRDNIYVRSAMNATVINVTDSQSCNVYVPYVYPNKYLRTRGTRGIRNKNFCTVEVRTLAPLRSSANDPYSTASVVVFAKLTDLKVEGMVPSTLTIAEHQMMALKNILIGAAEGALGSIKGNRDYPRDPSNDTRIVPVQSQSWCIGRNSKIPLSVLRLDNLGITRREENKELSVENIASKSGLIRSFLWRNDARTGAILSTLKATPIYRIQLKGAEPNKLPCYYSPPLTCLASLFKYWRGTLKFTLDVCASAFHNGRIILNFFPGVTELSPDNRTHLSSTNRSNTLSTQLNLKTDRTVTFNIPFNYDRDFCNIYDADHCMYGVIGVITVSVLNRLVLIGEVSSEVQCFVYLSACDDLELSVPTSSVYGLSWDRTFVDPNQKETSFKPGYDQVYIGEWRFWKGPILRYGTTTDHIAQISNGNYDVVYGSDRSIPNWGGESCNFFCCPKIKGDTSRYLIPFRTLESAKDYVLRGKIEKMATDGSGNSYVSMVGQVLKVQFRKVVEHESEDNVILPKCNVMSQDIFGEGFQDLKDYVRRFQPYTNFDLILNDKSQFGRVLASIPLTFSSLSIDLGFKVNLDLVSNKTRNGSLALLASAFRYFSGSMRVRIVIDCKEKELVFNAVHVPNAKIQNYKVSTSTTSDHLNNCIGGYANVAQAVSINQVLDLEVPYYNPTPISFLQRGILDGTNLEGLESLGCLNISVLGKPKKIEVVSLHVYIAAGDDTSFSNFCSFPMVTFSNDIPEQKKHCVEHEMFSSLKAGFVGTSNSITGATEIIPNMNKTMKDVQEVLPKVQDAIPDVKQAAHDVGEAAKSIKSGTTKVDEAMQSCAEFFKNLGQKGVEITNFFFNMVYKGWEYMKDFGKFLKDMLTSFFGAAWRTISNIGEMVENAAYYLKNLFTPYFLKTVRYHMQNDLPTKIRSKELINIMFKKLIYNTEKYKSNYDEQMQHPIGTEIIGYVNKLRFIAKLKGDYNHDYMFFDRINDAVELYSKERLIRDYKNQECKAEVIEAYLRSFPNIFYRDESQFAELIFDDTHGASGEIFDHMIKIDCISQMTLTKVEDELSKILFSIVKFYPMEEREDLLNLLIEEVHLGSVNWEIDWIKVLKKGKCWIPGASKSGRIRKDMAESRNVRDGLSRREKKKFKNLEEEEVHHENESSERSEADPDTDLTSEDASSVIALGLSLVSFMTGAKTSIFNPVNLCKEFFKDLGVVSRNTTFLIPFTQRFIAFMKKIVLKTMKTICPQFLPKTTQEDKFISFLKESLSLTDPVYENKIKKSKTLMTRLRSNKILADTLVSKIDPSDKSHHSVFTKIIQKKLEATCNNISHFALSTRARYDPFVLCLVGPPNIGKSFLINECAQILVDNVGLKYNSENLTFTRFPGNQFWQMVEDQPILVYDDFLAIGGQADETVLSEFLTIKSTQTFNPPVAELANKNQYYNPLGVILTTNNAFPDIKSARCPQAVHRRRDCLVHCRKKEQYSEVSTRLIDKLILKEYGHLEFCIQHDPLDSRFTPMNYVSYSSFVEELKAFHRVYHDRELPNYEAREAKCNIMDQEYSEEEIEKFVTDHYSKDELLNKVKSSVDLSKIITSHEMFSDSDVEEPRKPKLLPYLACPHRAISDLWGWCEEFDEEGKPTPFLCDDMGRKVPVGCDAENCSLLSCTVAPLGVLVNRVTNPELFLNPKLRGESEVKSSMTPEVEDCLRCSIKRSFEKFLTKLEKFSGFSRIWCFLGVIASGLATIIGAVALASRVSSWFKNSTLNEESEHQQVESSGDDSQRRKPKSKPNKNMRKELNNFKFTRADHNYNAYHQYEENQHLIDLQGLIRNNFFELVAESNNLTLFRAKGLGLCGRYSLIVKHFFESWLSHDKPRLFLEVSGGRFELNENSFEIFAEETSSLALIHFCRSIPLFRDIRRHIATMDQHTLLTNDCMLYWKEKGGSQSRILSVETGHDLYINGSEHMGEQNLGTVYNYRYSGKGCCGNILISLNKVPKIVGIHVAGTGGRGYGYAQPILKEQFEAIDSMDKVQNPILHENGTPDLNIETEVLHDGIIEDHLKVFFPSKSRLEKLQTYGEFHTPTKVPAPLTKRDERVEHAIPPLKSGVDKHGFPPLNFNNENLVECYLDLQDKIMATSKPIFKNMNSVLDHRLIFEGIPGEQGYSGIKLDTSEGYPLVKMRGKGDHDKRWLFEFEMTDSRRHFIRYHQELGEYIEENEKLREKGIIPNALFLDALKDTLIKEKKLQDPGCTRVFSESPVELTVAFKRYFGHFQASLTQNRIRNEMSVGINAEGREWGDVVRYLVSDECDPKIVTGDYSHYGDSIDSVCLYYTFQIALEWYRLYFHQEPNFARNQKVRETLVEEILHPQHLAGNKVYRMFCGIPSGFALTVEMNSLVNAMYMRMAALDAGITLRDFNRGVRSLFYGDDLILSVATHLIEKFNFHTISNFLAKHNIAFTSADKERKENSPYISLWEATFLKRGFQPHPYRPSEYLSPLPEDSLLSQTDYSWLSDRPLDVALDNSRSALRLAHCLGPKYHGQLRRKITNYWIGQSLKFDSNTWKEEDNRIFM